MIKLSNFSPDICGLEFTTVLDSEKTLVVSEHNYDITQYSYNWLKSENPANLTLCKSYFGIDIIDDRLFSWINEHSFKIIFNKDYYNQTTRHFGELISKSRDLILLEDIDFSYGIEFQDNKINVLAKTSLS